VSDPHVPRPPGSDPVARPEGALNPPAGRHRRLRREHAAIAYVVLAVAALIVLRALVDELDFISFGWILVLAALPLLPWLLPRLGDFLKAISPYVQSLKLGGLQLDLRVVRREAISVPSQGILASVPNDVAALSSARPSRSS
jgi:hypothetical protein